VLVAQLAALLLFVFNADRLSVMFVGAMCAVGTLNVNGWGFPSLITQMAVFFLAAMWLAINHVDTLARDYPLVRIKYALLLLLLPVLASSFWLELQYFLGLKANVITSCCGSMFSEEAKTIAAEASGLEPEPALWLFYAGMVAAIATPLWHWRLGSRISGYLTALTSGAGFVAAITGVLSFVSLYIYEHPHHHCPFCILKPEYGYQGYLLYLPLFAAAAAGLAAGVLSLFAGRPSLATLAPQASARLAGIAAAGFALFVLVASVMVLRSNLILLE